jgi:hypothetical protein
MANPVPATLLFLFVYVRIIRPTVFVSMMDSEARRVSSFFVRGYLAKGYSVPDECERSQMGDLNYCSKTEEDRRGLFHRALRK